ncbi:MAG TPA: ABC transporter substrate-binding protein [Bellilinea sp.]|nr:ABC transporter substrate-binding protein [Bellilinea sp.]
MVKKPVSTVMLIILLASQALAACGPKEAVTPAAPTAIKLALLPTLDVLPMVVAQQEGLYTQYNLAVEIIPVASAPERDQLIAAGQADAIMNELTSVMFLNQEKIQVQAVRYARTATVDQALFSIMAGQHAGIIDVQDLKGASIGISQATIIEYLTDRLLTAEGFNPADMNFVAVPKIPDRMSLLSSGELKAATLPEPFVTLAKQAGAVVALDDTVHPEFSYSVITFSKAFINANPAAVTAFLTAVEDAVELINKNPQKYAATMVDQKMVPAPLAETFTVPTYPTKGVPSEAQFSDVLEWVKTKGYLSVDLNYEDNVNGSLLP